MNTKVKDWMSRKEAAAHLASLGYPITPKTLANLAVRHLGPPYRLVMNRWTSYSRLQLEAWMKVQTIEYEQEGYLPVTPPEPAPVSGALISAHRR